MRNRKSCLLSGGGAGCLLAAIILVACSREGSSRIVKLVEEAGAGDLHAASVGSIVHWFEKHPALALKTDSLCVGVRTNALAKWPETTEGRVCNAASQVAGYIVWQRSVETNNDHQTFQGGSK